MSDLDHLLVGLAAGDTDAFATYLAGAEDRLRASLASFAAVVDVEAVVQETFLRVWQVAPRIEVDARGDSLMRFTIRVARNLAIDLVRREGRVRLVEAPELTAESSEEPAPPDPTLRRHIVRCHQKLPGQPARALHERLASGGADHDRVLAQRAGMTLNTFLKNIGRARQLLAACLERLGVTLPAGGA
ncbi:MAG: sigma factor [bacterium]